MKQTNFKKTVLTLAILLAATTGAMAQFSWSGTQTLADGDNITQNITLTGNVTINVASGTATLAGQISGAYSLTKTGNGTLVLTANNTYSGATVISGGDLQLGNGGTSGNIENTSGITVTRVPRQIVVPGQPIPAGGGNLIVNRSNEITISKVISLVTNGTAGRLGYIDGNVIKQGSGTLILIGTNTYSTATYVRGGTLQIGNNTIIIGGNGGGSIAGNIALDAGTTLSFYRGNAYTYDGVISGAGNVRVSGRGRTTLSGVNTYTGTTTAAGNTIQAVNAGKLTVTGSILTTSEIGIGRNANVAISTSSDAVTYSMPITGMGSLTKEGSTRGLTLSNAQYTGATNIDAGYLVVSSSTFPSASIALASNENDIFFDIPTGQTLQYDGVISGTGEVCLQNGKLILTGVNTYTGNTVIYAGTLQVGNGVSGSIDETNSVDMQYNAGTIRFEPATSTVFTKRIDAGSNTLAEYKSIGNNSFTITESWGVEKLIIESGEFYVGRNSTTGTVWGDIENNGKLAFYRSNDYTYAGVISGTGGVYKRGESILTLNGANTYTGKTIPMQGTITLGAQGSIAQSSGVDFMTYIAKFDISAGSKTIKNLNGSNANCEVILGTRTLTIGTSGQNDGGGTYAGKITGTASASTTAINKYGSATLTLTGTSSYTGRTLLRQGITVFNSLNNFGTSQVYVANNCTLKWAAGSTTDISPKMTVQSGATLDVGANNVTFASAFTLATPTSPITKLGTGKLTYTAAQTYTGATNINEGTLEIGTNGAVAGNIAVANGAKLSFNRFNYTYAGVISGAGQVEVNDNVILTGENTYTGETTVNNSILRIGNAGTTGSIVSNITLNNSNNATSVGFNRSDTYTYSGVVSGTGMLAHQGTGTLVLNGANTYTSVTGIYSTGTLELGTAGTIDNSLGLFFVMNSGKFKITSDKQIGGLIGGGNTEVQLGGILTINDTHNDLADLQSFDGVISGTGGINKIGDKNLSLNGANTYTGTTNVRAGMLILGANGTLNTESVNLYSSALGSGKLDVSAGNKILKNLSANHADNEVILGGSTLQIGTSTATGDGGGVFIGKFSGTGGVSKTGFGTLSLSGTNTATGMLSHATGKIGFSGTWAGSYSQAPGTTLDVTGNTTVGGNFTLAGGGNLSMNLTTSPVSKINVAGIASVSGTTTVNVTATAGTYTLIQAASGLGNAGAFTFNQPGFTLTPQATGTQLNLTVTVTDNTAPNISSGSITPSNVTAESMSLAWTMATDAQTPQTQLRYFVYQSASNNITTVANCEANGTLLNMGGTLNIPTYVVSGLNPNTTYYFNVVVVDAAGNKAVYSIKSQITGKATLTGGVTITGNTVFGQTLTAVTSTLTSNPAISNLGTLTYQWKRGATNIGTNSATYTLAATDVGNTITVTVSATNTIGSVTSPVSASITKATQTAPAAPSIASKTHNSITLNTIAGCEYRMDGDTWQTGTTFNNLNPETEYEFEVRKAETATHFASPVSESVRTTTNAAPIPDKIYQGIQQVTAIEAPYNSAKTVAGLGLPTVVIINTDQGNITDIAISWNVEAANYIVGADPEQSFTVTGSITLPAGIVNPNGVLLSTRVNVTVAARPLNPQVTDVSVTPQTVSVQQGHEQQFYATITAVDGADESVEWTITGQSSPNTIISSAGYLSIDANESATTITVKATSQFDNTKSNTAIVTVTTTPITPQVNSVSVNPTSATVEQGQQQQFTAIVEAAGDASIAVNWTIEGAGSAITQIDASGLLLVGADENATSITVKATSQFDGTKFGIATVTITAAPVPQVLEVKISPNEATVKKGETQQFFAEVTAINGADEGVSWYIEDNMSPQTTIIDGLLSVATDEIATAIKVRVVSNFDFAVSDEIVISISTTGISDVTLSDLVIYPNPFVSTVFVENAEGTDLWIVNDKGQIVEYQKIMSNLQEISVGSLTKGVYLFNLTKDGKMRTMKIVKK